MQLDTLRIVGNGPGRIGDALKNQLTVTFNPSIEQRPMGGDIQISNWKHAGLQTDCRPFIVTAPRLGPAWCREFEEILRNSAIDLAPLLGCFPSSGLVAIHGVLQLAKQISIYRVPLKPSLVRIADMSPRKPLPCAFHNWLGERRLGLCFLREFGPERLRWKSLSLEPVLDRGEPTDSNPLMLLLEVFRQGRSVRESELSGTLAQLAAVEQSAWRRNAKESYLTALESHFFLSRESSVTPNWWLYSNRISVPLDRILHRLMLCQLELMGNLETNRKTVSARFPAGRVCVPPSRGLAHGNSKKCHG